jgi:hypothetical protein
LYAHAVRSTIVALLAAPLLLASSLAHAAEQEEPEPKATYVGPLVAGLGVAVVGGGVGILTAAEDEGVTIGGSVMCAFGIGGLMGGTTVWMMGDLTEDEAEDEIRQGGVALTAVGAGAATTGGIMILSSFLDASDVNTPTRMAGIIAAGAGGAAMLAGLIMYGVGGPPPEEEEEEKTSAVHVDVAPGGDVLLRLRF